ncbi:SWIM zinc finger domain-containing protein [Knoellia locipacati]|uniref:SWIM zinc finger family protein n=1 Tax=Knoellia locipacati TaxID=882824 RepID=UPI0038510E6C
MSNLVGASRLDVSEDVRLQLETGTGLTPTGLVEHPTFFSGIVERPDVVAAGILAVADVASTTYLDLSALAGIRDPVVTASGDRLRFESFSGCNGVHARFDLLADGIASGEVGFGTTNVDVNQPLRGALASLPRHELMHLGVGPDALRMSTPEAVHEERKVELPTRWVRGFAEVPMIARGLTKVAEVGRTQAMAFLAGLPRGAPGPTIGVVAGPRGLRTTASGVGGGATLAGAARLTSLRRLMRHVRTLSVFAHESGASGWVAEVEGGRVTLLVSPQPYRGFSGEGQLLPSLAGAGVGRGHGGDAALLLEHLAWEPVIDPTWLALETSLDESRVVAAIAELAASGKVGYDVTDAAWFHREVPLDTDAVERDHPRLRSARRLVDEGAVSPDGQRWVVGDGTHRHWVSLADVPPSCTCRWYARYAGGRGPCSHVLAALLASEARPSAAAKPRDGIRERP